MKFESEGEAYEYQLFRLEVIEEAKDLLSDGRILFKTTRELSEAICDKFMLNHYVGEIICAILVTENLPQPLGDPTDVPSHPQGQEAP